MLASIGHPFVLALPVVVFALFWWIGTRERRLGLAQGPRFFQRNGILRVETLEAMIELPTLLLGSRPVKGRRVGVVSTTGGGAAMVVDAMAMAGRDIVDPPQALVDWLKPLGIAAGEGKLVDLTLAGAKPEIVSGTIERLLADPAGAAVITDYDGTLAPLVRAPARAAMRPSTRRWLTRASQLGLSCLANIFQRERPEP